jgi:hypothetical protein
MPDIGDVMDVNIEDLSPEQQQHLKDAADQFQQKCLLSFKKNRSGVPYLKNEIPRVLLPGESDTTTQQEREECMQAFRDAADDLLSRHHRAFLGVFKQMMVAVFGPGMEQVFNRAPLQGGSVEIGESSSQPPLRSQPPPQGAGGQPVQPPLHAAGGQPVQPPPQVSTGQLMQQPNPYQPTYGELAFGSSGVPLASSYRIAPASNRLQKNLYGGGYHEVMNYGAIDALPNPGYGPATCVQEDDILVQKMADLMQNQFGLKPKMQGPTYTPPFPKWYYNVILPPRVKPPTEFTKFSGQDDTSTVEPIARYLVQLGECSSEEAFRVRYFPMSLTGATFQWFSSLPPQ